MAVPHQAQLRDQTYLNWVRAGLGLKYTKEGIELFIDNEAKEFHSSLLNQVGHQPQNCGQCTAENLLPHHISACPGRTNCICSRGQRNMRRFCPNTICGSLFNVIVSKHRFKGPSWKNSHISQWVTDHWEVAKNFLPNTGGYTNVTSAIDTDLSGLVNIGINLENIAHRHNLTVSSVDGPDDFIKCRTARNKILHSPNQSLTDDQLTDYLNDMKALLQCTAALLNDATAKLAVTKLTQLETLAFEITDENITEVRQMALLAIQNEGSKQVEAIKEEGEKQKEYVVSRGESALDNVGLESNKQRKLIKTEVEVYRRVAVENIQDKGNQQVEAVNIAGDKQIKNIQQAATTQVDARYQEEKNKLKHHLIDTYIAQLQPATLPEVDRLYVEPCMKLVTDGTGGGNGNTATGDDNSEKTDTDRYNMYKEILEQDRGTNINNVFFQDQTQFTRIYISGDAGHGKTALCKMLVLAWCQEHSGKNINNYIPGGFLTAMKKFDFLFYIPLRNIRKDWIISEIVKKQYFEDQHFLSLFLKNEGDKSSCLLILDGLDEWAIPTDYEAPMHTTHGLLDLNHFTKYTVLTTTRPSKLEMLRLGPLEMDRQLQLTGISEEASDIYIEETIDILNQKKNVWKESDDFRMLLYEKQLTHLQNIPILLKQLLTLWHHDEKEITGSSQVHLYSAMINHLLKDAWKRGKMKLISVGNTQDSELPLCLGKKQYCKIHESLLFSLAHLAFTSTFKGELIFNHVEAEIQNLTERDINFCLKSGLLCQEIYASPFDDEKKKLSFLHKSFQDFLAAVFITMKPESAEQPIYVTYNTMEKILDMRSLLIFVSGMDCKVMTSLSHQIHNIIENDLDRYYNSSLDLYEMKPIQDLMCECVGESDESGQPPLYCYLEHVVISQRYTDWKNLQHLISTNLSCIKYVYIDIFGDPPEDILTCLSLLSECQSIQQMSLALNESLSQEMDALLDQALSNNRSLSSLKLVRSVCKPCCRYLNSDRVTTLVMLQISYVFISSHRAYESLMEGIGKATQLEKLSLFRSECGCKKTFSHHLDLSNCSQLQTLSLVSCHVSKVTINTTSLKLCTVYGTPVYFVQHPHVGARIQTLTLKGISDPHSLNEIFSILPHLPQLSTLRLDNITDGKKFSRSLDLSHCSQLHDLILLDCNVSKVTIDTKTLKGYKNIDATVNLVPHPQVSTRFKEYIL